MNVLLIEDNCAKATEIVNAVQAAGHTCNWVTGMLQVGEEATAILPSGNTGTIRLREYEVALVDGCLVGELYGWDIVPSLVRCGVICIGISGGGDFNPKLRQAGARLACPKERVIANLGQLLGEAVTLRSASSV